MATIELESMAIAMPEVKGHPNRAAFRGVLTVVDAVSQRAPSGSGGRRVLLTKPAAEAALPSLLGMALDYAPSFDRHDVRQKVGVITRAEVVGRNLEIGGHLFARDFPEVVAEVEQHGRERTAGLRPQTSAGVDGLHGSALRPRWSRFTQWLSAPKRWHQNPSAVGNTSRLTLRSRAAGGLPANGSNPALGMSFEVTGVEIADARAKVWILTRATFTGAAILRRDKAAYQDTWIELC
jgi:hypothetical protein